MSGQWEVVGRNKKDKITINDKKNAKQEKKNVNTTKVEDVRMYKYVSFFCVL